MVTFPTTNLLGLNTMTMNCKSNLAIGSTQAYMELKYTTCLIAPKINLFLSYFELDDKTFAKCFFLQYTHLPICCRSSLKKWSSQGPVEQFYHFRFRFYIDFFSVLLILISVSRIEFFPVKLNWIFYTYIKKTRGGGLTSVVQNHFDLGV